MRAWGVVSPILLVARAASAQDGGAWTETRGDRLSLSAFVTPYLGPEAPFLMSALTLTSSAVGTPPAGDASENRHLLPLLARPASARRRFMQDERVEIFDEITIEPAASR